METTTLPEWLAAEMKARKMNQTELAKRSGITPAQISRILSGQRGAESKTLYAIAVALKVPPDEIYRIAGMWENNRIEQDDEILQRISHLYRTLKDQGNKERALEYLQFLTELEEKNAGKRRKP